jgi:hypothetical protein
MKFRKKPVVIEATQWFKHGDHPAVTRLMLGDGVSDTWAESENGWIHTLEGGHRVAPGDWIITGVKGEFYPCKDEIFRMTYEPAGDDHA